MAYYALEQYEYGSRTTINGVPADRLHSFETKADRDDFVAARRGNLVLTRREAEKEARKLCGVPLSALDRLGSYEGGLGSSELFLPC